jgi:fumarate hydratase class II
MLSDDLERIEEALRGVYKLALGGTAGRHRKQCCARLCRGGCGRDREIHRSSFLSAGPTSSRGNRPLMLVTALAPVIGYDKASKIAHHASEHDLTLKRRRWS